MKKLLSFVIVALMMVSSIVPVFAVSTAPEAPDPAENAINIWVQDAELDVETSDTVTVTVNLSDNNDGFTSMKVIMVYPPCLEKQSITRGKNVLDKGELQEGDEKDETTIDKVLTDFFDDLGLDVETVIAGKVCSGPLIDCVNHFDPDAEEDVLVDNTSNGTLVTYKFKYDASKNPDGLTELPLEIYATALHCEGAGAGPYAGQHVNMVSTNGKITLLNVPTSHTHTPGEAVRENEVPATCTTAGSYDSVVYCTECGEELSRETVVIDALQHDWSEWVLTTEATPEHDGEETRTCSRCDAVETRPVAYVPAHTHVYNAELVAIPTATTAGKITYTCVDGDDTYDVELAPYGEFAITVDDVSVIGGEDATVPVVLKNTEYGVDSLRFLVSYDSALTLKNIELATGVYAEGDDLVYKANTAADIEALAENEGLSIVTEGRSFATVVIDPADLSVRKGDGAIANLVFATPAANGEYAVEIISIEDASVTLYDAEENFLGFIDYELENAGAAITAHVHNYTAVLTKAPTADEAGVITYTCEGCGDVYTEELAPYGEFNLSIEDVAVLGGEEIVLPVNVKNTEYGIDTLRFLIAYDSGLTFKGAELATDVYAEGDELVCTETSAADVEALDLGIETEGKSFLTIFTDVADLAVRTGDGAIVNLKFEAPAQNHVYGVELINVEDASATIYDEDDNFLGFVDYTFENDNATVKVHVHEYKVASFVAPKAAEDGKITYKCTGCDDSYEIALPAYGEYGYQPVGAPIHAEATDTYTIDLINTDYGVDAVRFLVYWDENLTVVGAPAYDVFSGEGDEVDFTPLTAEQAASILERADVELETAGKKFALIFAVIADDDETPRLGNGALATLTVTAPEDAGNYEIGVVAIEEANVNYYDENGNFLGFIDYETVAGTKNVEVEGHNYEETVVPATCTEDGLKTYTCSVCGDTYTEVITAPGHTAGEPVRENEVPATCTEAGSYDEVVYCTVCEQEISRETKTIDPLGHDYVPTVTPPTCTEQGYTTYVCSRDPSHTYVSDYVDALDHDYVEVARVEPSCKEAGSVTYRCTRCNDEYTEDLEKLPHTPAAEWELVKEPTANEDGLEVLKCTVCGEVIEERIIAAKTIDLQLIPSARLSSYEIDNNAKTIKIVAKKGQPMAVYQLKLAGAPQNAYTFSEAAFEAGNKLQIKGTTYSDPQLERPGIRYFISYPENGYKQTYTVEVTSGEDVYIYTVSVEFEHDPAVGGVEPGYSANKELTGFSAEDDHLIQVVSKPGAQDVSFRVYLAKGATIRVASEEKPHIIQTPDKGATYEEVTEINDNAFAYFKTVKAEELREFDLRVTYANGEAEEYHVVVTFVD